MRLTTRDHETLKARKAYGVDRACADIHVMRFAEIQINYYVIKLLFY